MHLKAQNTVTFRTEKILDQIIKIRQHLIIGNKIEYYENKQCVIKISSVLIFL